MKKSDYTVETTKEFAETVRAVEQKAVLLHDSTLARVRPFSQPLAHDTTA